MHFFCIANACMLEHHCKARGCNHKEVVGYLHADYIYFFVSKLVSSNIVLNVLVQITYMLFTTVFWLGLFFHLNDIVVLFQNAKVKGSVVFYLRQWLWQWSWYEGIAINILTLHFYQSKEKYITSKSIYICKFGHLLRITTHFVLPEH